MVQSTFLGQDRQERTWWEHSRATLFSPAVISAGQFVGDEPVSERGVIGTDVAGGVDQVCIAPITLCQKCFASFVEGLGSQPGLRQC
jgi:hypothetical protein